MADIFLSYAREDLAVARSLAAWLEHNGWSVWWDRKIYAGKVFDTVITRELSAARCVLVLWTRHSVGSDWVKDEATEGVQRQILVPVVLDEVPVPLGFRRIQAARLVGWEGDISDDRLKELRDAVLECAPLLTTSSIDAPKAKHPPERLIDQSVTAASKPRSTRPGWIVLPLIAILSIALGWVAAWIIHWVVRPPEEVPFFAWGLVTIISMYRGYRWWRKSRKDADGPPLHRAKG